MKHKPSNLKPSARRNVIDLRALEVRDRELEVNKKELELREANFQRTHERFLAIVNWVGFLGSAALILWLGQPIVRELAGKATTVDVRLISEITVGGFFTVNYLSSRRKAKAQAAELIRSRKRLSELEAVTVPALASPNPFSLPRPSGELNDQQSKEA